MGKQWEMIKPVYFSKKDEILIEHVNGMNNFSEWVKKKIRDELGISIEVVAKVDIEMLIRKIIKEEKITEDEKVDISIERKIEETIVSSGWTL